MPAPPGCRRRAPRRGLLQQLLALEPVGKPAEAADREIGAAAAQGLGDPLVARQNAQRGMRRLVPQPRDQRRDDDGPGIFGAGDREPAVGPFGNELARRQRELQLQQALPQAGGDLGGALGRLHAVRPAHEQFVLQHIAQPVQRMADRRLRQPQPRAGAGRAALLHQRLENAQQVQVEIVESHRLVRLTRRRVASCGILPPYPALLPCDVSRIAPAEKRRLRRSRPR